MLAKVRGLDARLKIKGGRPQKNAATIAALAAETGVSERTARHRMAAADAYDRLPKAQQKAVDQGKATLAQATRWVLIVTIFHRPSTIDRSDRYYAKPKSTNRPGH